jgi:hypothetical protein
MKKISLFTMAGILATIAILGCSVDTIKFSNRSNIDCYAKACFDVKLDLTANRNTLVESSKERILCNCNGVDCAISLGIINGGLRCSSFRLDSINFGNYTLATNANDKILCLDYYPALDNSSKGGLI